MPNVTTRAPVRDLIASTRGVVGIEHGDTVVGQCLDQFALGLRHRVATAELAEMRGADVEHDTDAAAAQCPHR